MKECERLLKEGRISDNFLNEEIRDGFFVNIERKKIWAIEFDMLCEFDRICKKHGLRYFLYGGTLLGAVRHKGFIPWDDDIDVAMLREDYEKLKAVHEEFKHPYFLQWPFTDPEAGYQHIKVRNSNTTAFNKLWSYRDYNFGIWIDVFPIDNYYAEGMRERLDRIEELSVDNSLYMKMPSPYVNAWDVYRFKQHSGKTILENYKEIERLSMMFKDEPSEYGIRMVGQYTIDRLLWPYYYTEQTVDVLFEGKIFPVPVEWDKALKHDFGNYMEFPPIEERINKHQHTIFEPDVPYKEYVKPKFVPYSAYLEYGEIRLKREMEKMSKLNKNL